MKAHRKYDKPFFDRKKTDQVKPPQQLNSSPNQNGRTVQQSLFDKSKFISSENNQQSPKSDSNLFHFDNLSILDPTQFDIKSASEKIPWKIEVTKSIISYIMSYFNVDDDVIVFSSDSYPLDWLNSSYAIKKVMIFPGFPD